MGEFYVFVNLSNQITKNNFELTKKIYSKPKVPGALSLFEISRDYLENRLMERDAEEYRKKIEKEVLEIMEQRLIDGEMNAERARDIAKFILNALYPHMPIDEIYKVVQTFDDHFPELVAVVIPVANEYEEKVRDIVTSHVNKLIQEKKIGEANVLLKKAIDLKRV